MMGKKKTNKRVTRVSKQQGGRHKLARRKCIRCREEYWVNPNSVAKCCFFCRSEAAVQHIKISRR